MKIKTLNNIILFNLLLSITFVGLAVVKPKYIHTNCYFDDIIIVK